MDKYLETIVAELEKTEHGFKHIMQAGDNILADKRAGLFTDALRLLQDERYQGRMLGVYLLGKIAPCNPEALDLLISSVALDGNWRVQEMLAKAIDDYCHTKGYEKSLPEIQAWLNNPDANVNRAVIEGLRIWTARPYFNTHPEEAISLISRHKASESEYLRKSVGNALRDISKKHKHAVIRETMHWDMNNKRIAFTFRLLKL